MASRKKDPPTYPLEEVKQLAQDRTRRHVTTRAKDNAWTDFGMNGDAIFKTVATLHERDFYKTMESETVEGTWQDVYHAFAKPPRYQGGVEIYCKVQILNGTLTVIQFKKKE